FFEITGVKNTGQINPTSLVITRINDQAISPILAEPKPISLEDVDQDGVLELMVKFNRQSLIDVLPVAEQVKVTLEGILVDQSPFKVDGFIRTIQPGAIPSHYGGVVFHPSGVKIEVSGEALPEGGELYIIKLSGVPSEDTNLRKKVGNSLKLIPVGVPYEFGPEGKRFTAPIAITIPYDPLTLSQGTEGNLLIAYWKPETKTWEILDSTVDKIKKVVTALTTHFSLYQIVAPMESQPDADFKMGEVYVFPNPARAGAKPTFHIEVGVADIANIRIYTISGEPAHKITLIGTPQIIDDGQGPQYAYESAWEGYIPSGIYLYVLTAERGGKRIKKTGKFVVVR
ncbi:MAG: T9SS type A sorting domain-containing protein, partial [Elusimicrobia bacterium]|nr:T9SS type A sorting domain-containing protein [Elusimicrobiota bacterium]